MLGDAAINRRRHGYRDAPSLDICWLKDESLADSDNPPSPEVIAQEIVEDPEAALEWFRLIAGDLRPGRVQDEPVA
jgi:hypothetical protein